MTCWFITGTNRDALPPLIFDRDRYNVVTHVSHLGGCFANRNQLQPVVHCHIHTLRSFGIGQLRVGDITLLTKRKFFETLRAQLDVVLVGFQVHYHFIAESPATPHDSPPPEFPFLTEVFQGCNLSFHNDMGPKSAIFHMANADMLVTTGSSFPRVAAAISPKVYQ